MSVEQNDECAAEQCNALSDPTAEGTERRECAAARMNTTTLEHHLHLSDYMFKGACLVLIS